MPEYKIVAGAIQYTHKCTRDSHVHEPALLLTLYNLYPTWKPREPVIAISKANVHSSNKCDLEPLLREDGLFFPGERGDPHSP